MNLNKNILTTGTVLLMTTLLVAGCAGGGGPGWTYAPLGPSPSVAASPGASPDASPVGSPVESPGASPDASPGGSPAASPGGSPAAGEPIEVVTTDADPLAFEPNVIQAPAGTELTVNYLNDSSLPHNINFFNGPDATSESLGATEVVTGPGALESVTFMTPSEPGDYYFWCDVHVDSMAGTLTVTE